ncbi:MAG: hypothetical protein ACFFDY_00275 [Candidatus Thorarchaeota archaeon]
MTRIVTIYRSDYNGHKDSEGTEYFNYLLGALGVPDKEQENIHEVTLTVKDFKTEDLQCHSDWNS